jgi:FtsZ-binding cell division protein ZapB
MNMQDVQQAYYNAFAADRTRMFSLASEFDAIRARFEYLKSLPDFARVKPEILTIAAQMGYLSRDLAAATSEVQIEQATTFLLQRQQEIETWKTRIDNLRQLEGQIRGAANELTMEEASLASQGQRYVDEIQRLLAQMGYEIVPATSNVVSITPQKNI